MPEVFKQMYTERLNCKQIWLEKAYQGHALSFGPTPAEVTYLFSSFYSS